MHSHQKTDQKFIKNSCVECSYFWLDYINIEHLWYHQIKVSFHIMYLKSQEQTRYFLPLSFVSCVDFFFFSPLAQSSSVVVLAPLSSSSSGSSEGWDCSVFSSSSFPASLHPSGWCPAPLSGCGCSAAGPGWPALPAGRPAHGRETPGWVCPAR